VTARTAAARYAKALFDVALAEGVVEQVEQPLQTFADAVRSHETLAHVFANPAIPPAQKRAIMQALIDRAGNVPAPLAKLVLLLAERDRLVLLPDLADAFRERLMDHQKIARGSVTSAMPLDPEALRALETGLGRATGRRVVLEPRVDPSIIGGVIARVGSTVYDGSVVTQLQKMKEALIEGGQ
jgi:F-type H+-transporting ATPase subunit delta